MDTWSHIPPPLQSLVLGNAIQFAVVFALRLARGRAPAIGPLLDRVGPKAVRDPTARRTSAGCGVAVVWLALSWVVGHEALHARGQIVHHLLGR